MNTNNDTRRQYFINIGEAFFLRTLMSLYDISMGDAISYVSPTSYPCI